MTEQIVGLNWVCSDRKQPPKAIHWGASFPKEPDINLRAMGFFI